MNYNRAIKFVVYASLITPISHYWYKLLDSLFPKDKRDSDENKIIDGTVLKKTCPGRANLRSILYFLLFQYYWLIGKTKLPTNPEQDCQRLLANTKDELESLASGTVCQLCCSSRQYENLIYQFGGLFLGNLYASHGWKEVIHPNKDI